MSQKRQQEDGRARSEGSSSEDKPRKRPSFRNVVREVMSMRRVHLYMEPLIRKVVKEEVELALKKYFINMKRHCERDMHSSESRSLQLQFLPQISLPVFTGSRIEGEDCNALKVALVDAFTGKVVNSGPESSAKVEIVVLEGDFDCDEGGNWTCEDFKNNIVRAREGKKPLLTGDALVNLTEGIALVVEISFTDNSSWTRSRKFRLGARVVDNFERIRVREATTESFIVRDHRGELYKKHHPPSLLDEVWRLEKIGKDGAFHKRLTKEKVYTVKDFLTLLFVDPARLKHILGVGMSPKMWEVTVDHAQTCTLDPRLLLYCPPGSQQKYGVVFNIVGQVKGLLSECQYARIDTLSETEKAEANNLVIAAFKQWKDVVPFDDEASLIDGASRLFNREIFSSMAEASDGCKILPSQKIDGFDYPQPVVCSSDIIMPSIYSIGGVNCLDDFGLHNTDNMDLRFDQPLDFPGPVANSLICETESISPVFCEDEHLQYFDSDCSLQPQNLSLESQTDLHTAVNSFLSVRSTAFSQRGWSRWTILFSVLRWCFSIKRIVARKTLDREKQRHHLS